MMNPGHIGPNPTQHHLQKIAWQMVNLRQETRNAFNNHHLLNEGHKTGHVRCMSECPKGSGPIVVIGSGSSVDAIMPQLKEWKGAVMCSSSHLSTLVYHGRPPDYMIVMDPRIAQPDNELDAPTYGDAVMLTHVSAPPAYLERWLARTDEPVYVSRIMEPSYDWYTHHLGEGYPWVNHIIVPMIDSLAAEISFATWLGYKPIYLAGADYGGARFQRWDYDYPTQQWKPDRVTSGYVATAGAGATAMSYSSRGSMLSGFMQIANDSYQQRIYQLSEATMLKQFPFKEWHVVLNAQGMDWPETYDRQAVLDELECALAAWDTFLVPCRTGWGQDYHTYITNAENNYMAAMATYNDQIRKNLEHFAHLELTHGRPLLEMMRAGQISIEAGELLLRGADEFGDWDWKKMDLIDIPAVLSRRRWLLEEYPKRGYVKAPEITKAQRIELELDSDLTKEQRQRVADKLGALARDGGFITQEKLQAAAKRMSAEEKTSVAK